jgi:hypothetical protein
MCGGEEGADGEQVAKSLVADLTELKAGLPQMKGAAHKLRWFECEREAGFRDQVTGVLGEARRHEHSRNGTKDPAADLKLSRIVLVWLVLL